MRTLIGFANDKPDPIPEPPWWYMSGAANEDGTAVCEDDEEEAGATPVATDGLMSGEG